MLGAWAEVFEHEAKQRRQLAGVVARLARPRVVACMAAWRSDWEGERRRAAEEATAAALREERERRVAHVQQTEPDQPPSGVTLLAAPAQAGCVATSIAAGEEVATPQPAVNNSTSSSTSENAKAAKARELREVPSAPSESDITEDEWAKQMIKSVGECFEAENYHDPNPNRVTACSAFEEYKTYVKKRVAACLSEEAPEKAVPEFKQEPFLTSESD